MTESQAVVDAFTEMASHYEQIVDWEIRQLWGIGYREFIRRFVAETRLTGAEAVLDVATGTGVIPLALVGRNDWQGKVVGLDITPVMLHHARQNVQDAGAAVQVGLVCGSGHTLPFADGSFDVALCALGSHHMRPPALLSEMHRVLRSGGRILLADVSRTDFWRSLPGRVCLWGMIAWYEIKQGGARLRAEVDALQNMMGLEEWRALLLRSGFTDPRLISLPARRRWLPSGLLMQAVAH